MAAKTTTDGPHSSWRNCKCPLNEKQDGICGCSKFWERKVTSINAQPRIHLSAKQASTKLKSPRTTPPGPPQEICFFWYHGTCRRGNECKLAHESHITWPMAPPPGFVHFEPCELPLCPLRHDLVAFKETQGREQKRSRPRRQLDAQLDGAALSVLSRSMVEGQSGDQENDSEEGNLIDPNSRPLNGSYSDLSEFGSDGGEVDEGLHQHTVTTPISTIPPTPPPTILPKARNMDLVNLSGPSPLSPASDCNETPLLSLSHPGTLGKRKRSTTPDEASPNRNNKRSKRGATLDVIKTGDVAEHAKDSHSPITISSAHDSASPLSNAPKGPRALAGGKLVCFYWYHKGHCIPKRKNGRVLRCTYAHTLDMPFVEVSLPPNIDDHRDCALPFCPVQLTKSIQRIGKQGIKGIMNSSAMPTERGAGSGTKASSFWDQCRAELESISTGFNGSLKDKQQSKPTGRYSLHSRTAGPALGELQTKQMKKANKQQRRVKKSEKKKQLAQCPTMNYGRCTRDSTLTTIATPIRDCSEKGKVPDASPCGAILHPMKVESESRNPRILVDYELPMGEDRLDWDTDRVRRLFGEIE